MFKDIPISLTFGCTTCERKTLMTNFCKFQIETPYADRNSAVYESNSTLDFKVAVQDHKINQIIVIY